LLQELRRRNVFRVGAAYAVVSWLIIQVIETISEPLGLPGWTEAFFIVLLGAGLPLALIFAWAFELTPEGLKKTAEVDREVSVTADTGKKLNYAIIVVLVVALGYFVWERQGLVRQIEPMTADETADTEVVQTADAASVAVLPFVNMSADPEQEYFSDGISEELLNLLAKIPELRVPARTSSFQFKGQNLDISEVARELNVRHVLEGSVRKADVKIRVTAQLIEAETGYHLWSETYDRELTDVFKIQDEISAAIVDALSDTLGLETTPAPRVWASQSTEAYNAYLLGQHLLEKRTKSDIEAAVINFEKAIELDPGYAPAHAGLGLAWRLLLANRQTYGTLTLEEMLSNALPHLERALDLDPELPEALGAMGLTLEAQDKVEEAIEYYERALAINPSLTDVRNWYASELSNLGRYNDAYRELEKAYELDPVSVLTLNNYVNEMVIRREFDAARPLNDRLALVDPARAAAFDAIMLGEQHRGADAAIALFRGIDSVPDNLRVRARASWVMLNYGLEDDAIQIWPYPNLLPIISATDDYEQMLELARAQLENDPTDPGNIDALAWAYWNAGNIEQALRNARRYLSAIDERRRDLDGTNWMLATHAWREGDRDEAIEIVAAIDANIDRSMEAGIELTWSYFGKAVTTFMRGDIERSLQYMDVVYSRNGVNRWNLDDTHREFGWNDIPEYAERRHRHDEYVQGERRKFLTVACGEDGFDFWQPSPETCAEFDAA
jgi:TolB-like protein/Flp pilus assembly protein TadD